LVAVLTSITLVFYLDPMSVNLDKKPILNTFNGKMFEKTK
jgi:hypothetical protein